MATKLTPNQEDAMRTLGNYVGRTVEVLTSRYDWNVNPDFSRRRVGGFFNYQTLCGLEAKGFVRIEDKFWKGARLTVLKSVEA